MKKVTLSIIVIFTACYLLINSAMVSQSVQQNLKICMDILIPSLFPFMFLSIFIVKSGLADFFGRWLEPIFRVVFKLPGCACGAMLTSFIGGYPAGAKSVVELYKHGSITISQAKRMINFCFCAGPAFMIGTVGGIYLGFPKIGMIMMISQIIGALILALFSSFGKKYESVVCTVRKKVSLCDAFVLSTSGAASSILSISAMVLVFGMMKSAICVYIDPNSFISTVISNTIEITGNLDLAAQQNFAYVTFVTTFGGFCVHLQIFSFAGELRISKIGFILSRIMHAVLSTLIAVVLIKLVPLPEVPVATVFGHHIPTAIPSVAGSAALIVLCIATVLLSPTQTDWIFQSRYGTIEKKRGRE